MTAETLFNVMLCADDYALSPAVSRGILEALDAGALTATSVMTTRPAWPQGAAALRGRDADVGLHLNLTLGAPLSRMVAFAPDGTFPSIGEVLAAARKKALPETEVRVEIACQLDAFAAAMGRDPDYVDGHQHVQVLPQIRTWLFDALADRGLAGKVWLRDSGDQPYRILRRRSQLPKAVAVAVLASGFAAAARQRGFATNQGFAGFSAFDPNRDYAVDFVRYLVAPGPCHLIMCHPGHVDEELAAFDPVTATRENELAFLRSDGFRAALAQHGTVLARFSRMILASAG